MRAKIESIEETGASDGGPPLVGCQGCVTIVKPDGWMEIVSELDIRRLDKGETRDQTGRVSNLGPNSL